MSTLPAANAFSRNQLCTHCDKHFNKCHFSQIDDSKGIDRDTWAVSILIHDGGNIISNLFSHHVVLIIEGFTQEGKKFWRKAHLMGVGSSRDPNVIQDSCSGFSNFGQVQVTKENYSIFNVTRFKKNKETWRVTREKVEKMLEVMKQQEEDPTSTPYRFFGEKSISSTTTEYIDIHNPELKKIREDNPVEFDRLYKLLQYKQIIGKYKRGYWNNTSKFTKIVIFSSATVLVATSALLIIERKLRPEQTIMNICQSYEDTILGELKSNPEFRLYDALPHPVKYSIFSFLKETTLSLNSLDRINKFVPKAFSAVGISFTQTFYTIFQHFNLPLPIKTMLEKMEKEIEENRSNSCMLKMESKIEQVVAQNCYNWASNHLKSLGFELPEHPWIEVFFAVPELNIPKQEKKLGKASEVGALSGLKEPSDNSSFASENHPAAEILQYENLQQPHWPQTDAIDRDVMENMTLREAAASTPPSLNLEDEDLQESHQLQTPALDTSGAMREDLNTKIPHGRMAEID